MTPANNDPLQTAAGANPAPITRKERIAGIVAFVLGLLFAAPHIFLAAIVLILMSPMGRDMGIKDIPRMVTDGSVLAFMIVWPAAAIVLGVIGRRTFLGKCGIILPLVGLVLFGFVAHFFNGR